MSQPSYAHATLASSKKVNQRSIKGDSTSLLGLTFAQRAVSKFTKTLLRKGLNGRSVAKTTPILPGMQASIASENISALLIQVDASCDRAPIGDRHSLKANYRRATIYASTYHGDDSQEIPSPVPVHAPAAFPAGLATTSSLMSALDRDISTWSSPDAPTPAAEPSSLMALIDDILLGRDFEPVPSQLATPPPTPLLIARPALDEKAATSAVRPLRITKKMPATLSLRVQYQDHPLPEPSSSLPGSTDAPTLSVRVEEALASLSLFAELECREKAFEEGKIQRRQQWAEWALAPMSTSASVETIKPAHASIIVDTEEDTDYYMCLCPLGRGSSAEEQTASRTAHLGRYLADPPEDFLHDRAYQALLRRWGHLVPELPAGSPVPEEFFRSLLA